MNDNLPDSERWVPVAGEAPKQFRSALDILKDADRARREAEAVIAKAFPPKP